MQYKTLEQLKKELKDNFDEFMYNSNIEMVKKIDKAIEYIKESIQRNDELGCTKLLSTNQVEKLLKILN